MRILITGGSGFIGSVLCKALEKMRHDVIVFDAKRPESDVEFIEGDILNRQHVKDAAQGCDTLVHLAAFLGVKNTENDPLKTLNVNILGTKNVLDACVDHGVKKLVFSSSSEVYGNPEKIPISEDDRLAPVSTYGFSKVVCERYINAYQRQFGLGYAIVRYFNVYGPGQRADFVLPKMVSLATSGKPLEVYGSGEQVRAFTHVMDAVKGTILAMEKGHNDVFNIGSDAEPVSMKVLAQKVVELTGSDSKIIHVPLNESDRTESREIFKRIPNIIKAREVLGYSPKKSLSEGIIEMSESFV